MTMNSTPTPYAAALHSAWIWYSEEPSPTTVSDRAVGARHPQADRGRQREAEHPHRADEAERRRGRDARRAAPAGRRRLLDQDRVARQALGERVQDVAGAQRLAGRAAARGRLERAAERAPGGRAGRPPPPAPRTRRRVAEHGERRPGCGAPPPGPAVITASRVVRVHQRPFVVRVLAQRAGADDQHGVVGRERSRSRVAPRRQVAGEQRMVLREARGAAERLLEHRAAQPLGERDERAASPRPRRR